MVNARPSRDPVCLLVEPFEEQLSLSLVSTHTYICTCTHRNMYTHMHVKIKGVFLRFGVVVSLFTGAQLDELRDLGTQAVCGVCAVSPQI